ncbi:MAG: tRNA uridine-5-carboxymethylaminomethyl(34) synthesis GTPase MnmE [Clostridia bacterium]|nr:tRNA uridine-5-carboxymethylaminomethyl(34) synthesis GTPase MnmE [Clostridia bacterium]
MLNLHDTIAAIATSPGEGGVAVIRISGPQAKEAAQAVFRPNRAQSLKPRMFTFGRVLDSQNDVIDEAMAVYLPAPHTYTREDVCEIQCHGGRGAPARVLERVIETGFVRAAEPGEFTKRAFLNGRIDLSEAEAVMGMIKAGSQAAARAAARQMEGGVSHFVRETRKKLEELLALVSAATDFPEEIDEDVTAQRVLEGARAIRQEIEKKSDQKAARAVREGVSIALAGKPNVGKSSLLNAAAGFERAIVSDIPGTTRDVLTERISFRGVSAELSDTAGQRETPETIEAIGVERARRTEEQADAVLLVIDSSRPLDSEDQALLQRADGRYIAVVNKTDLSPVVRAAEISARFGVEAIEVSARTGEGVERMLEMAFAICGAGSAPEDGMVAARHIECAKRAVDALRQLEETIEGMGPLDIVTDDLWRAMYALSEITGEDASEDVIDAVFANFCVGK